MSTTKRFTSSQSFSLPPLGHHQNASSNTQTFRSLALSSLSSSSSSSFNGISFQSDSQDSIIDNDDSSSEITSLDDEDPPSSSSPLSTQPQPIPIPIPIPTHHQPSETLIPTDQSLQQSLSSELLRMAFILKSNSIAFAESLERDRILVEKTSNSLNHNLDLLTKTRGNLASYSKKVKSLGWFTFSAIVMVLGSWVFMFFIIRLT